MRGLTRPHYAVVTLMYVDGYSQAQIAEALKISPAAVSKMHARALDRLRKGLALMGVEKLGDL